MRKWLYPAVSCVAALTIFPPVPVTLAQDQEKPAIAPLPQGSEKPAIAPQPRTINLTQEQRYIIKENVKDLTVPKAPASAPEKIGDVVPRDIDLHSLPPEVAKKVAQARSHLFFVKEGSSAIVLVSPNDRRVADVIN